MSEHWRQHRQPQSIEETLGQVWFAFADLRGLLTEALPHLDLVPELEGRVKAALEKYKGEG